MNQLDKIHNNTVLNSVIDEQIAKLLKNKISSTPSKKVNENLLRKAVWLASILAESNNEAHKKKAQDLAILLFLNNKENKQILKAVYVLLSRIGNLTATRHLNNISNNDFTEDFILLKELINKRIQNSILIDEESILLTDFQKDLFKKLNKQQYVSISAPTSSGKSFILKKYIELELNKNDEFYALYIVPSRALINQVSEDLRISLKDVKIRNSYIEDIESDKKEIYVITPERAVKIINSENVKQPNLIFIDEIQNVEDENGRGILFEYIYEEFSKLSEKTKIITAGPFISNPKNIFNDLFQKQCEVVQSSLSPVFQLKTIIQLNENSISLNLYTDKNKFSTYKDIISIDNIKKIFSSVQGSGLAKIVTKLSKENESNIIYCSNGNIAESWALKYASEVDDVEVSLPQQLKDLIDYLKKEIHKDYYLITCLKNKIGFHYSSLSEFVRKEIENLFEAGIIKTLFCTSTLIEGVNLPADNLYVVRATKNHDELSNFEFGNLVGRVGRLSNTLYGTIYCVSKDNATKWADDFYSSEFSKEVKTSNSKALENLDFNKFRKPLNEIDDIKIKNLVISLRNRFLKKDNSIENYLSKYNLNIHKTEITSIIQDSVKNVTIPYNIVKKNPTVDVLLQDKLYKEVLKNKDLWLIHKNPQFTKRYNRETANTLEHKTKSFFWQLDDLISQLNEIFLFKDELFFQDKISISLTEITINTVGWISGNTIGKIIKDRINYYSTDERVSPNYRINAENIVDINRVIKTVIKINQKVITYRFLKYLKILTSILDEILSEEEKEEFKLTLALPMQIELGTQEPIVISLISGGVPRTIAIKLFNIFKKTKEYKSEEEIFDWLKSKEYIKELDGIYNKFLRKNHFLKLYPSL